MFFPDKNYRWYSRIPTDGAHVQVVSLCGKNILLGQRTAKMCNLRLLHYRSFRELGAFGPPGWLPATWDLWLFSGFAKKYNCMYHRYSKNETSNGDAYSAIIKLKYQNAVSGFYSQKCVLTELLASRAGGHWPPWVASGRLGWCIKCKTSSEHKIVTRC